MPEKIFEKKGIPWNCVNCGARLGLLDPEREILTIKVKDSYIWIKNGDVSMTCRLCGSINSLEHEIPTQKEEKKGV